MRRRMVALLVWLLLAQAAGGRAAPRRVTFGGKVVDARGQPAGGALVSVSLHEWSLQSDPAAPNPVVAQTRAAADGSFHLEQPLQAEYWSAEVVAVKDGSGPGGLQVRPEMNAARLLLALTLPSFLAGRVVDSAGQPVPGARVVAEEGSLPDFGVAYGLPEGAGSAVRTDAQGRFRIEPVPAGSQFSLRVEHPRYARGQRVSQRVRSGTDSTRIVLAPGGSITARVRREDGAPVARAAVRCIGIPGGFEAGSTDSDGRFKFSELPAGTYTVVAEPPPGVIDLGTDRQEVKLPEGGEAECPGLRLPSVTGYGRVTGKLADAVTGLPVAGLLLLAEQQINEPHASWYRSGPITRSGADGGYQLRLPAGNWIVVPYTLSTDYAAVEPLPRIYRGLVVAEGETVSRDFVLRKAPRLQGQVLDASGQPAAGARVWSTSAGAQTTDLDGRFSLRPSLPSRELPAISVLSRDRTEGAYLELSPDQQNASLTVRLRRVPPVTGQVTSTQGKPIPGAQVRADLVRRIEHGGGFSESRLGLGVATTDAQGRFSLLLFPNATFSLVAEAEHYAAQERFPVQVRPGSPPTPVEFRLDSADGFVAGLVVDPDGKPIAGAFVSGWPARAVRMPISRQMATTDARGRFRLESLPAGEVQLTANLPGCRGESQRVPVGATGIRLTLFPREPVIPPPSPLAVGARAPEISVTRWVNGPGISGLSALRGKTVVLQFSAAYNPAAAASNAALKAVYAAAKERGRSDIVILAIYDASLPAAEVEAYARGEGLPFPIGLVEATPGLGFDSPVFKAYGVRQLPAVFVLDDAGIVRAVNPTRDDLLRLASPVGAAR
jgi:uncharacterized GH25 family protein